MMETKEKNKTMMLPYYDLLRDILDNGTDGDDRTGTGTRSLFGKQLRFDLNDGFPLLTGKFTPFKLVAAELLWFISGSTNNNYLKTLNESDKDTIWEEWALPFGNLGPIYGHQWRHWDEGQYKDSYDQIASLIRGIKERPHSRRHIVSAWNPSALPDEDYSPKENVVDGFMALAPCHYSFQMDVTAGRLSCLVNIRSSDTFLGLPFNIASYALLTHMVAEVCDLQIGELIVSIGNAHIYSNHMEQVNELLSRDLTAFPLPIFEINRDVDSIDDFQLVDFQLTGYKSYPAIKASVAI